MLGIESLYTHTFTISRVVRSRDNQGGWSVGYTVVETAQGRLRPRGSSEQTVADQEQAKVSHVLYCAASVDVRRGDLVSGAGKVVEVIAVREPSQAGHHLECDCLEIQKEAEELTS
jgi:head-tail adaptor